MHCHRIAAFDKNGLVAVTGQKTTDSIIAFATPDSRTGNLIFIEMQNGKDCAVAYWVQELVSFPAAFQRAGFGLAVANDRGNNQVGVIKCRTERVHQNVT